MSSEFFSDLLNKKKPRKGKDPELLNNLYKTPRKDKGKNQPHFQVLEPNEINQADLLFLPNDSGYKYALVVVDDHSKLCDAEPLKNKTAKDVIDAFKTIYHKRKILKVPSLLEVDAGSEFKGEVAKWLKETLHVDIRVAKVARHRQQAIVERKNQQIGSALAKRQTAQELLTGEPSTEWVKDLPIFIKELNKRQKKLPAPPTKETSKLPTAQGDAKKLLTVGTKVRVALDAPADVVSGKRLHGKFRSSDIRWNQTIRTVKEILLNPGQPPMYLLNGDVGRRRIDNVAYTKAQLQVVHADEKYPSKDLIANEEQHVQFRVKKLLEKVKRNGKWYFKVRWEGYGPEDDTFETRSQLMKEIPDMVKEFEANQ